MLGELCPYENLAARSEGTVSIRTDGAGRGRIYISKSDMTSNIYHSIIGRVTKGLELARMASPGQRIAVMSVPRRLSVLGMSLEDAEAFLTERGVKYEKAGYQGDGAVVVEQQPETTMEIVSGGQVKITSIPRQSLVEIELYRKDAPRSVEYFSRATGLKMQTVGALDVFFKYEDTMLFKGKAVHVVELIPENKPAGRGDHSDRRDRADQHGGEACRHDRRPVRRERQVRAHRREVPGYQYHRPGGRRGEAAQGERERSRVFHGGAIMAL